jgi:hypothetical protein
VTDMISWFNIPILELDIGVSLPYHSFPSGGKPLLKILQ